MGNNSLNMKHCNRCFPGKNKPLSLNQQLDEIMKLLKSTQAAQLEQKALIAKLDSSRKATIHVPPSAMKKFKSGHYRLSNGKTW